MGIKNSINALTLEAFDSAGFNGISPVDMNANGIDHACFWLFIINNSNQDIFISFDGSHLSDWVPKNTRRDYPVQNMNQPNNFTAIWPKGTKVYGFAPAGMGDVYIGGFYQKQGA